MCWSSVVVARRVGVAVGLVALALVLAGVAGASASRCRGAGTGSPNVGRGDNFLQGVAAASACNAWAVGYYLNSKRTISRTLVEHWNGRSWKVQRSPSPSPRDNELDGVAATSAKSAWAVGFDCTPSVCQTLIEHWNGKAWTRQVSPNPSPGSYLRGVTARSAKTAWAVGYYYNSTAAANQTLVEHWNGKKWTVQPSPNRGGSYNDLAAVAASSSSNAWAVGRYYNGTAERTLIEHWNGKEWTVQPSPNGGSSTDGKEPQGVAAISPTTAWMVGDTFTGTDFHSLIERWNGKAWKVKSTPHRASSDAFAGVAAVSPRDIWAVGEYSIDHTLIEHWNGKAWKIQPSSGPSPYVNRLDGVAAISSTDAWAVGVYWAKKNVRRTLIEYWNGTVWKGYPRRSTRAASALPTKVCTQERPADGTLPVRSKSSSLMLDRDGRGLPIATLCRY